MSRGNKIPVIDLFAGPGGLSEGFSSILKWRERIFELKLSIEKDPNAHETLELRSFFRQFKSGKVPIEYYEVLRTVDLDQRRIKKRELYTKFPVESTMAQNEAWLCELGLQSESSIDKRISKAIGKCKNWVLTGGPPCQAYSLVGRSRRKWKNELDIEDKRVHLYKEYLRIIARHQPAVFVMENVRGLLSAKVEGKKIFSLIKKDLSDPQSVFPDYRSKKYKIYSLTTAPYGSLKGNPVYKDDKDFLIQCEEYGIPQKRHRVILLGVREDIKTAPGTLSKIEDEIALREVIGDLPKIRSALNRSFVRTQYIDDKEKRFYKKVTDSAKNWRVLMNSFRSEIISWNGFAKDYSDNVIRAPRNGIGSEFIKCDTPSDDNPLRNWYQDKKLKGACNHQSRSHLVEDLKRYMFSSMFTKTHERFPRLREYNKHSTELLPDHKNALSGKFADRFRVQLPDSPATTITSHISKDGHYFIHYDPDQCRSLTVREAARIQTFPDNYLFCGSRTAQFRQVGNAVPPYLAKQIGELVHKIFIKQKS